MIGNRRDFFRTVAPAVALPMLATPLQAKEVRLVTRDEIMEAFRFFDFMELRAGDLNLRYQILIDMLFETNPETLRAKLQQLVDGRKDHSVLIDPFSGQTAPYDPAMYDEVGNHIAQIGHDRVEQTLAPLQRQLEHASVPSFIPRPRWRYRIAGWLMGWRA